MSYYFIGQQGVSQPVSGSTGTFSGAVTGATFNATANAASYQIGANTVLESDGTSVYLSPNNDTTGGVFVYTAGVEAVGVLSTGNVRFAHGVTIGSGDQYGFTSLTQLLAPVDGQLRIAKNTIATAPTTLVSGIVLGPKSSSGVSWVYDSSVAGWRSMNGDQSANAGIAGTTFRTTNADGSLQYGSSTYGLAIAATTTNLVANNVTGFTLDSVGSASMLRWSKQASTSGPVTVTAAQSYTLITNRGASGSVTFNIPAPTTIGLHYTFCVQAAQQMVVTAASGNIYGIGLSGTSRTIPGILGNNITIISDGTDYFIVSSAGTIA